CRHVEAGVNQQDHAGCKPLVGYQTAQDVDGTAAIDRPGAHRLIAIRADTIFVGDECPAMRAHAARIHKKGKSTERSKAKCVSPTLLYHHEGSGSVVTPA